VTVEKIDDVLHEVLSAHGHVDDVRGEASPRIGSRLCASQGSRSRRTTAPAMRRRSSGDSASPSASITVPASASAVFALLADARRHPEIDGSGAVRRVVEAPDQLVLGSVFVIRMKAGMLYATRNTVVEYEPDRRIAWRHRARHIWRRNSPPPTAEPG